MHSTCTNSLVWKHWICCTAEMTPALLVDVYWQARWHIAFTVHLAQIKLLLFTEYQRNFCLQGTTVLRIAAAFLAHNYRDQSAAPSGCPLSSDEEASFRLRSHLVNAGCARIDQHSDIILGLCRQFFQRLRTYCSHFVRIRRSWKCEGVGSCGNALRTCPEITCSRNDASELCTLCGGS